MATNTPNVNLIKPDDQDNADLKILVGENMDIIDSELAKKVEKEETTGRINPLDLPTANGASQGAVAIGNGLMMSGAFLLPRLGKGLEHDATNLQAIKLKIGAGLAFDQTTGALVSTASGSGTVLAYHAYQSVAQAFTAGAWTKVSFEAMNVNVGGGFDLTLDEYVAPETGVYNIGGSISWRSQADGNRTVIAYYKNGVSAGWIADISAGASGQGIVAGDTIVSLNAGDKLSMYVYSSGIVDTNIVSGNALTYFYGYKL
jgi:hypothetical protein